MTSASDRTILRGIFRRSSTTFYWTSRLFPTAIRDDVEALYAFVRVADDCVDELPADPQRLDALEAAYRGEPTSLSATDTVVVRYFRELATRHAFDPAWITAFFDSMRADLAPHEYRTLDDTLTYIYGSAEVMGFMMARIMGAQDHHLDAAGTLGRAFQYINMIRDIGVDQGLGRTYLPTTELKRYGLSDLSAATARANPEAFTALVCAELSRYRAWQAQGEKGISALPYACRPAMRAACTAYLHTADVIEANPLSVYEGAYKPSRSSLFWRTLISSLRS